MGILADVAYGLRGLRNAPGYALSVILTLGLGLGAATAMLAIVDSVLVRPLALPGADRFVEVSLQDQKYVDHQPVTWEKYLALRDGVSGFEATAAYTSLPSPVAVGTGASTVMSAVTTSPSLFAVAAVRPVLGRVLLESDSEQPIAVIGNEFWRKTLGSNPAVLGTALRVGGKLKTIVGVLPAGYNFPMVAGPVAVYSPLEINRLTKAGPGQDAFYVVARRRAGVSAAQLQEQAAAVQARIPVKEHDDRMRVQVEPFLKSVVGEQEPALLVLLGACGILLLIAIGNAANLQIARSAGRAAEMQMRAALGASHGRLLRQLVTESVTVSSLGAAVGLGLAWAAVAAARGAYGTMFPRFDEVGIHWPAFAACALLAVVAGVASALAPAVRVLRETRGTRDLRITRAGRVSSALVIAEVGLTFLLLVAAGLFLRTFRAMEEIPLGLSPDGVSTMVLMPENPAQAVPDQQAIYARLAERLEYLPGVRAAAFASSSPFSDFQLMFNAAFHMTGEKSDAKSSANLTVVGANYMKAMQIPVVRGRGFGATDSATATPAGLVNEEFLRRYGVNGGVLGRQVNFEQDMKFKRSVTIVGIVGDSVNGNDLTNPRRPVLYLLPEQFPAETGMSHFLFGLAPQFVVKANVDAATLGAEMKEAVRQEAPGFAVMSVTPMRAGIADSLRNRRLALRLAEAFGGLALVLALVGIYGVLSYAVAQRRREIGIRMALGSSRERMVGMVLRQAGLLCSTGLVLGLCAAWPLGKIVRGFLFGVTAMDPLTLVLVGMGLGLTGMLAALVPARRAAGIDPMMALRSE